MKVIKVKPRTNGSRHYIKLDKGSLIKNDKIFKTKTGKRFFSGRSSITGRITVRHRGGGHKKLYRNVMPSGDNKYSIVLGVSYDPNRNALISNNFDFIRKRYYTGLVGLNVSAGSLIKESTVKDEKLFESDKRVMLGYRMRLNKIPVGSVVSNISLDGESPSKYVKSAGSKAQLIRSSREGVTVKLSTGLLLKLSSQACANVGMMSNEKQNFIVYGKAGRMRNLARRPSVRGIAMNPVDHPHGGKSNGGFYSVSPWGILTKCGFKLRKKQQQR
jgi:large subunit ribosomal protein L2